MDRDYIVGGHRFRVSGERLLAVLECIDGFKPFRTDRVDVPPEFVFRESERESVQTFCKGLYSFKYEDIDSVFGVTADGYLLELHPAGEKPLCLWMRQGATEAYLDGNCTPRLLRFALWMGYGILTVRKDTVAVHSSCIVYKEKAVLFLGESGTGKSTHTSLWREHIAGSKLLNDDSPVVCYRDGKIWVHGSPWSGKTPCYKAECYPLAGCVRLSQAPYNRMYELKTMQSFAALHPSTPPAFAYDSWLYDGICGMLGKLLPVVPVYHLACLPDREAAELACRTLFAE